uniref:Uncharacterized protein n=1 Tax=viral metagenome TaxID=1070528 RepID=A0A6C0DRJ6_9ZZZZ
MSETAAFINAYEPISNTITTSNNYEYFGFRIHVHELILNESVSLRINVAYLLNGAKDPSNLRNDGTYSYVTKFAVLTGDDYANWGNNDQYIYEWVNNNFQTIINSTLFLHPKMINPNEM